MSEKPIHAADDFDTIARRLREIEAEKRIARQKLIDEPAPQGPYPGPVWVNINGS